MNKYIAFFVSTTGEMTPVVCSKGKQKVFNTKLEAQRYCERSREVFTPDDAIPYCPHYIIKTKEK